MFHAVPIIRSFRSQAHEACLYLGSLYYVTMLMHVLSVSGSAEEGNQTGFVQQQTDRLTSKCRFWMRLSMCICCVASHIDETEVDDCLFVCLFRSHVQQARASNNSSSQAPEFE